MGWLGAVTALWERQEATTGGGWPGLMGRLKSGRPRGSKGTVLRKDHGFWYKRKTEQEKGTHPVGRVPQLHIPNITLPTQKSRTQVTPTHSLSGPSAHQPLMVLLSKPSHSSSGQSQHPSSACRAQGA